MLTRFFPFLTWFQDYDLEKFRIDAVSGLTVALILIPQSMAYAQLSGKGKEIDVIASAGPDVWVCQSKWRKKKAGIDVVRELQQQADMVQKDLEPLVICKWLFTDSGLTRNALDYVKEKGILWSDRKTFDALLEYLGLRTLPEIV